MQTEQDDGVDSDAGETLQHGSHKASISKDEAAGKGSAAVSRDVDVQLEYAHKVESVFPGKCPV